MGELRFMGWGTPSSEYLEFLCGTSHEEGRGALGFGTGPQHWSGTCGGLLLNSVAVASESWVAETCCGGAAEISGAAAA